MVLPNLGLKYYFPSFIYKLRYRNRKQQLSYNVHALILELGIYYEFNTKRGKRGRRSVKASTVKPDVINVIDVFISNRTHQRQYRPNSHMSSNGSNNHNLTKIDILRDHYQYPRILYCNIRSINKNFDFLQIELSQSCYDVIILSETWITNSSKESYELPGFRSIHRVRDRGDKHHGGGVSIYLNINFSIHGIRFPINPVIDAVTVTFRSSYLPSFIPHFVIVALYFPPNDCNEELVIEHISEEIDRSLSSNHQANVFVLGDFNNLDCDFLKRMKAFRQIVTHPTHGDALLDLCFTNTALDFLVNVAEPIGSSDHSSICLTPKQIKTPRTQSIIITTRPKKHSNFLAMGRVLSEIDWSNWCLIESVNFAADLFHGLIQSLYNISFPEKKISINLGKKKWIDHSITQQIKLRQKAFKNKNFVTYHELCKSIGKLIKTQKGKWFKALIGGEEMGSSNYYDIIRKASNINKKKAIQSFPNKSLHQTYSEIFCFFKAQANIHDPLPVPSPHVDADHQKSFEIDRNLVYCHLAKLKRTSSTAPDGIPQFILAEFAFELSHPITHLINQSIRSATCPDIWKRSFLCPIPKVPHPVSADEIRPISVLPCVSKICERIVFDELISSLSDKIDPCQYGGLRGRSTIDYLFTYLNRTLSALDNPNTSVVSLLTDYSKAYDNVDHRVFMDAFLLMEPPEHLARWMLSFLHGRVQLIKTPADWDEFAFSCSNGVPQGTVLGGLIFAVTVNKVAAKLPGRLKFVDDQTISSIIHNNEISCLQPTADTIISDSAAIKLPLNKKKCFILTHDFKKSKCCPVIKINDHFLESKTSIRLLGLIIQDNLKWDLNTLNIIQKANSSLFILYNLKKLKANRQILLSIYKSFIRPKLEYCSALWHTALTNRQSCIIESFQRRVVRLIMGKSYCGYEDGLETLRIDSLFIRRSNSLRHYALQTFKKDPLVFPKTHCEVSGRNTRFGSKFILPRAKTKRYRDSPLLSCIRSLNNL